MVLFFSAVFTACSDDKEEEDLKPSDALSGTEWKLSYMSGYGISDTKYNTMVLTFGKDGSYKEVYSSSESYAGTYTISGGNLIINADSYFTRDWGHEYYLNVSGSTMTLEIPNWDTIYHFDKK